MNTRATILSVVGARPNFMKLAPVARALAGGGWARHVIVHTGQHYDHGMSQAFFDDLDIPPPDVNLEVGSGTHAVQTGRTMERLEPVLAEQGPAAVLVYGDVNSTVAASLVAAKMGIAIGHVEAGLRSRDWTMPEEINRVVTDRLADMLFTPSRDADANLRAEGVAPERIHFVGNVMIDSLVRALPAARSTDAVARHAGDGAYALVTLHRPGNVDDPVRLDGILAGLRDLAERMTVVFPLHPRTRTRIDDPGPMRLLDPVPYPEMLALTDRAALVITDSGGLQEETSYLGVPCLTVRPNTERPVTVTEGTNRLVAEPDALPAAITEALARGRRAPGSVELWDGRAAGRLVEILRREVTA